MDELLDKLPYHCIITGPTNCGKTQYLIEKLRSSYKKVFEYIVLICPTYIRNKTYHNFANGDKRFIVLCPPNEENEINSILEDVEIFFSGKKTLVILDDCAFTKDLKQRSNNFISLAFSGRHANISLWVLTQQITAIAKPFRENVACVVGFFSPNRVANQTLFDEFAGDIDLDEKNAFMKILKSEKYARLCCSLRHPFQKYVEKD